MRGDDRQLYREFQRIDDVSSLAIERLALAIAAAMSRRTIPAAARIPPPWLERAREILHTGFTAPPTVARLADTVGVHAVYLAGAFHRHYGRTIGDYVRRLRIEFACRELSASEPPSRPWRWLPASPARPTSRRPSSASAI